jgi:hypothetical protein
MFDLCSLKLRTKCLKIVSIRKNRFDFLKTLELGPLAKLETISRWLKRFKTVTKRKTFIEKKTFYCQKSWLLN